MNGSLLISSFLKTKIIDKGFIVIGRISKGVAFACGPSGINVQKFGCRISHLFCRFAFGFVPLAAAEFVQGGLIRTDTGVAANQLQLADGYIKRGFVGIFQVQEFLNFSSLLPKSRLTKPRYLPMPWAL